MSQKIPPWLQDQIRSYQGTRESLQQAHLQIQQIKMERRDVEMAREELEKSPEDCTVYKQAGPVMVQSNRQDTLSDLGDRLELAKTRIAVMEKQKAKLEETVRNQEAKINEAIRGGAARPPE